MSTGTIKERVAKGAALMDVEVPGWERRIDVERLRMESCFDCIIGQIFNVTSRMFGFSDAADTIGLHNMVMIADHGFDIYPTHAPRCKTDIAFEHSGLKFTWIDEIVRRLSVSA